ncbi:MAG TPA: hypothetical protein VIV11_36555 [Kofleriaceae bacterium]
MRAALLMLVVACGGSKSATRQPQSGSNDWQEEEFRETSAPTSPAAATTPGSKAAGEALATCKRRDDGAFDLSAEDMLLRRGLGARTFGEVATTADTPIEVCGTKGELEWLLRATCADGSRPWGHDRRKAHAARHGSRPTKGRCADGTPVMIDLYEVPCPEQRYSIYMNLYECGPGESLWPQ